MVSFSLKRLFASVSLIAIGVVLFCNPPEFAYPIRPALCVWMSAGILVGAGIGLVFRSVQFVIVGALLGLLIQYAIWCQFTYLE